MRRKDGFTLLEVMIVAAVLGVVTITLYYLDLAMLRASLQQDSIATLRDEGRQSMQYMARHIRNARGSTLITFDEYDEEVPLGTTPVTVLAFHEVTDLNSDGWPTDSNFDIEMGPLTGFTVDDDDIDDNGESFTQLMHLVEDDSGGVSVVRVLTDKLNTNGGLAFRRTEGGVQITLSLSYPGSGLRPPTQLTLEQVISPRN